MGTPTTPGAWDDALNDWVGLLIQKEVRKNHPTREVILDVGAGWGKYRMLLPEYMMDACEAYILNVVNEELRRKYRKVFIKDICDLPFYWYDVLIFGDVLEHITTERAQELIANLKGRCGTAYFAVPFLYPQGEVEGNKYEIHEQADLTPEVMAERYPDLEPIEIRDDKGVYKWQK